MTQLRIYGPELGETDTVIDCTIDTAQSDILQEEAVLTDNDSSRTWTLAFIQLRSIREDGLAIRHDNMSHPSHPIWDRLSGLRTDLQTDPFNGEEELVGDVETLFQIVVQYMRTTSA